MSQCTATAKDNALKTVVLFPATQQRHRRRHEVKHHANHNRQPQSARQRRRLGHDYLSAWWDNYVLRENPKLSRTARHRKGFVRSWERPKDGTAAQSGNGVGEVAQTSSSSTPIKAL